MAQGTLALAATFGGLSVSLPMSPVDWGFPRRTCLVRGQRRWNGPRNQGRKLHRPKRYLTDFYSLALVLLVRLNESMAGWLRVCKTLADSINEGWKVRGGSMPGGKGK